MELTAIAAAAAMASAPAAVSGPAILLPADGAAAARFAEVMRPGAPLPPDDPAGPVMPDLGAASPALPPAPGRPLNIGESILSTLQNVSDDMRQAHAKIHSMIAPEASPMTIQQGLALQFQMAVSALQYDLVGKVVSKSIQNVDQLVKMQ